MPKAKKQEVAAKATKATKATKAQPVSVELPLEAVGAFHAFTSAKKAEADAKEAKEQAELILREALGSATEATINGMVVIKVQNGKNTHFDRKLMEEAFPEAYKATLRETLFTWLKTL
jgi:hypothetical protein